MVAVSSFGDLLGLFWNILKKILNNLSILQKAKVIPDHIIEHIGTYCACVCNIQQRGYDVAVIDVVVPMICMGN